MSNVLQGLHIKSWWLKASLMPSKVWMFELWDAYTHSVKADQDDPCPFQWKERQVFPGKADRVKEASLGDRPSRDGEEPGRLVASSQTARPWVPWSPGIFPGSAFHLSTLHYQLLILNLMAFTCCFGLSLPSCLLLPIHARSPGPHIQPHPHLG